MSGYIVHTHLPLICDQTKFSCQGEFMLWKCGQTRGNCGTIENIMLTTIHRYIMQLDILPGHTSWNLAPSFYCYMIDTWQSRMNLWSDTYVWNEPVGGYLLIAMYNTTLKNNYIVAVFLHTHMHIHSVGINFYNIVLPHEKSKNWHSRVRNWLYTIMQCIMYEK